MSIIKQFIISVAFLEILMSGKTLGKKLAKLLVKLFSFLLVIEIIFQDFWSLFFTYFCDITGANNKLVKGLNIFAEI